MLGVEVGRFVLLVEHADDDAEKDRDDGHVRKVAGSRERGLTDLRLSCERNGSRHNESVHSVPSNQMLRAQT
jgi:hypothetical protein